MFHNFKILKFDDILNYFLLKFMRHSNNNVFDKYFGPFLPTHTYSVMNFKYILSPARLEIVKRSPVFRAISIFNSLPSH